VTLDSVRINGERYPIKTTSITEVGKGRGKRTGIGAGGGAVVGGIIGAIAGGGKGAAIGAGAGAGAGAVGAGFTGDRDIEIDAETKLRFTLRQSIEVPQN
jgi:outer membrane lipoprotein SlyB